jgi:hypothetical protein
MENCGKKSLERLTKPESGGDAAIVTPQAVRIWAEKRRLTRALRVYPQ